MGYVLLDVLFFHLFSFGDCVSVLRFTNSDYPLLVSSKPSFKNIFEVTISFYFFKQVIQRRLNGSVDFNRIWKDYKMGFGSPYGEYWLGNTII